MITHPPPPRSIPTAEVQHPDQPLFTRFIRLGTPYIELNAQGRARPSLARLYNWRYRALGDLPHVAALPAFAAANAGFAHDYQLVDVQDYNGRGETSPMPYFYQVMRREEGGGAGGGAAAASGPHVCHEQSPATAPTSMLRTLPPPKNNKTPTLVTKSRRTWARPSTWCRCTVHASAGLLRPPASRC